MSKWTVIGFWYEDEPEVVGVVAGDLPVYGGSDLLDDSGENFQGGWSLTVEARTAVEAEELAVHEMVAAEAGPDEPGVTARQQDADEEAVADEVYRRDQVEHDTVREQTGEDA